MQEIFSFAQRNKVIEGVAALINPVAAFVGNDNFKAVAKDAGKIFNRLQFVLAAKIIADVFIKNLRVAFVRSFNQNRNGNGSPRTAPENFSAFAP